MLEEFLGIGGMIENVEQLAQPAILPSLGTWRALLVDPVRGHAELGHLVHLARADLHLDALPLRADDAGVKRAVIVRLGRRDVVLETAGHHGIAAVDDAERVIALLDRVHHDAKRHDVRELLEADILVLHLEPDRIGGLLAPGHGGLEPAIAQRLVELVYDALDEIAALGAQERETRDDALPRIGIKLGEGQILQLVFHLVHADALGERRVDLHRLARDAAALLLVADEAKRPHVVEAIGELHQEDADVLGHGEHELPEILRLLGLVGLQLEAGQLGDPVDELGDVGTEQALDVLERRHRVLDRVVQQPGDDRGGVELHPGEDARDLDGMREIGIARGAQLRAMRLHREDIGAVERILVGRGIVALDALDQLELAHHGRLPRRAGAARRRATRSGRRRECVAPPGINPTAWGPGSVSRPRRDPGSHRR